jgi:NADH-quinone oxidoreductase subunit N
MIYAFMEMGAFGVVVAYGRQKGGGYFVSDYDGLAQRAPAMAVAMAVFLLSLAGIPWFAGWAAKFFVFRAVISGGGLWLGAAMAVNTVIALFYYVAILRRMFLAQPSEEATGSIETPVLVRTALAAAAIAIVVVGILPELFAGIADLSALI